MKTSSIIRIDTFPISTNNMYAGRKHLTPISRRFKDAIMWEARADFRGEMYLGRLHVRVDVYYRDKKRRDLDNMKMLFDSLTGIAWKDDSQIDELFVKRHCDPVDPRIIITITKL